VHPSKHAPDRGCEDLIVGRINSVRLASKIAGHATVSMAGDYTFVDVERQEETTLRIQQRMEKAKAKVVEINRKKGEAA
jgi:hypothetical protein